MNLNIPKNEKEKDNKKKPCKPENVPNNKRKINELFKPKNNEF